MFLLFHLINQSVRPGSWKFDFAVFACVSREAHTRWSEGSVLTHNQSQIWETTTVGTTGITKTIFSFNFTTWPLKEYASWRILTETVRVDWIRTRLNTYPIVKTFTARLLTERDICRITEVDHCLESHCYQNSYVQQDVGHCSTRLRLSLFVILCLLILLSLLTILLLSRRWWD